MSKAKRRSEIKSKISQEKLLEAMQKKKLCSERAQKSVEKLIENGLTKELFLSEIKYINQSHYEDIVEERYIAKLCGYPLCTESLTNIPHQQYIISIQKNKVYDITDRKKFCSTDCFKSSQYIKQQILTSPLWVRDENSIYDFHLFETGNI